MLTEISFFESLIVTIFSMGVVFLSLIAIAAIINRIKLISNKGEKRVEIITEANVDVEELKNLKTKTVEKAVDVENYEELVAVIAAAIACTLGVDVPDINIQTIRRIPQYYSPWRAMGKQEQLFG
ncbi:hypothetical protein E9840_01995 [Tissierella creatinini]|nr:hypothetical protein E9840_01995 [Tissierella creatinini]TJX63724.1 hypothetical protein E8P77_14600 [Soehngenia saccharolytica]